ncbi:MAG TPA: thioredoxin domain-containing protein [Blastocatellia bacterium]|nr:thioredoxin domain-containing protein [Blastocatellia bacterium]
MKNDLTAYLLQQRQRDEAGRFARQLREAAQVKILAPHPTPPESAAERARVFAVVNGQSVTSGDVEDSLQPLIYQVQDEIYRLRQTELNLKINDTLLGQEAQQRGITPQALLDAKVMAKVTKATESEARAFYDQNRDRLNGDFAALKSQIIDYLSQQAENRASAAFAAQLRQKAAVQIFLTAPVLPKGLLTTDGQPVLGSDRAAVTIIEFTDYECQSCAQTQPVLERLLKEYEGRVKLVVRDFPLAQHAQAFLAAEAAEAARAQGRYQEYHKLLFQHQAKLSPDELRALATQLGLDRKKFDAALESHQYAALVQRDLEDGNHIGINATPSLFINGRRVSDRSYEALKAAIEAALKEVNGTTQ